MAEAKRRQQAYEARRAQHYATWERQEAAWRHDNAAKIAADEARMAERDR